MAEVWKPVLGYEGLYEVSDLGRVKSRRGRIRKQSKDNWGYPRINLCKGGVKTPWRTHLLVAEAFLGPRPEGLQCRHLDGDQTNNRAENLAWGTSKENQSDLQKHLLVRIGKKHPLAKLNPTLVRQIRETDRVYEMARELKISAATAYKVRARQAWQEVV